MYNSAENRINIYEDTMKWCGENPVLSEAIKASVAGTVIYHAGEQIDIPEAGDKSGKISVIKERSFQAAMSLNKKYPDRKIAVHNFASATNPGGGVEKGSGAQEECLCRCSTLHPCLKSKRPWQEFYTFHRSRHDVRYTDACIYTPKVYVVKSDTDLPQRLPENEWISVDIITCAAPNLRERPYNSMNPGSGAAVKVSDRELLEIHKIRAEKIIRAAIANKADCLVLGAFGCGAFCNSPQIVARAYQEVLQKYRNYFDEVVFAVYCSARDSANYDTFSRVMSGM